MGRAGAEVLAGGGGGRDGCGVAAGAVTSGETVFRRGAGARGAARVDPLLRRISGLTRFDRVSCDRWLVATTSFPPA